MFTQSDKTPSPDLSSPTQQSAATLAPILNYACIIGAHHVLKRYCASMGLPTNKGSCPVAVFISTVMSLESNLFTKHVTNFIDTFVDKPTYME